jgi:hypothetical protein
MFEWILRKVLGSAMFEKFVGTKVAMAIAALVVVLINHGLISPEDQTSAATVLTDAIAGLVAVAFMIARAWTDTTAIRGGRK